MLLIWKISAIKLTLFAQGKVVGSLVRMYPKGPSVQKFTEIHLRHFTQHHICQPAD